MENNKTVSNYDLLKRIESLEAQLDTIIEMFERAQGAWLVLKWIGSIAIGASIILGSITSWRIK